MSTIHLAVLGPLSITRDAQSVELNIAKVQALLTYLAVTRTPQTREHLLGLLWAESHPDAARKNLRNHLWQLRQSLGEDVVIARGDRLALAPIVWCDVAAFETGVTMYLQGPSSMNELTTLLNLWRGPLLDGISLSEAPDFELWLTTERERLGQLYLRGLKALISNRQQAADWGQVATLAQRGLAYDPLHEPLHQSLMIAYAQQGGRTEALRQYDQLRTLLTEELGVEPLPETDALRMAIVNGETKPANHSSAVVAQRPTSSVAQAPSSPAALQFPPLIGRQAQLAELDRALQEARQGQCKVLLISGELGMGKTRLWQSWSSHLPADAIVLETRCLNTTQALPFDPVRRLLNGPHGRTHFMQIATDLLPIWRTELLRLAPGLQQSASLLAGRAQNNLVTMPVDERGLVAEALTQFLRTFAAQPLIFFLDDLHWADGATLDWLLYLTDRMVNEPLLLIGAYRPEDAPPALLRLVAQWQREGLLQLVPLPNLTKQETVTLLTALTSNGAMADYLHTQSGGNPYYLTQLSDVAVDGIPASLADLVQARLSYLSADLQPILQAAAILEPAVDAEILRLTSGRSEEETLDGLDGLLAARVLVERADAYEFAHPLVATVVREGLSSSRRKFLHRRAATGLAARYGEQGTAVAGQLARHYAEAGEPTEAARFAEIAGEEALRMGAFAEAAAFYQGAYRLAPTPTRQLGLGRALSYLPGKAAEARTAMQNALESFEAQSDCQGTVKAGLYLAASYLASSEGTQVLYWARRVLPDLETVADPMMHASAHYLMGTAKFRNGYSMREAADHYAEATQLVTTYQLESEIALMSWFEWGNLCLEAGDYAEAVPKFQQAWRMAQAGKSMPFAALTLNNLAYATLLTGDVAAAQRLADEGMRLAETYALLPAQQYFYSTRGEIALAAGNLTKASDDFEQALALAEKYDKAAFAANVRAHLGRVAQARGALDEAYAFLRTARASLTGDAAHFLQTQIDLWLAELHLQRREPSAAEDSLRQAEVRLSSGQNRALQQKVQEIRARLREL